ncbi:sulfate/molybdate ABC transporter ATP-binding protein [Arthrobacter sp. 35W]|uniref:sulfate/molybdate ABC transporter ATP-binding protein n=1 Tax=Arthrobacter sp. 35W TaxID=1132441 RepID=UPI000408EC1C|nr:ABC transporter ATP-binding protein [Arthrobacter sp. 35W]
MTFTFEATVAARGFDVSLALAPGQTVAVLGANGAGKSTLLAAIAGLLRPEAGSSQLGGTVLFDAAAGTWVPPHLRGTVLLAQEPRLFPHLSVLDNVAFGPLAAGASRRHARETARHWLAEVEASALAGRRPGELSGGQAQRVAIARALAANPELLLLDEPLSALDVHAAALLRRLLTRVLAGRRAIIVTHSVLDALMLSDAVVVLDGGRVAEAGPTREVLARPRSRFAAGLAGLNLLHGTLGPDGLSTAGGQLVAGRFEGADGVPAGPGAAVFPPSSVSVFLAAPHGSPRNTFAGVVTELEPHGDQIRVRAGDLSAFITPAAAADLALAPGVEVFLVVKAAEVAIFPV